MIVDDFYLVLLVFATDGTHIVGLHDRFPTVGIPLFAIEDYSGLWAFHPGEERSRRGVTIASKEKQSGR